MSQPQRSTLRNRLLRALPAEDVGRRQLRQQPVAAELHRAQTAPHMPIRPWFLPEIVDVSVVTGSSGRIEGT